MNLGTIIQMAGTPAVGCSVLLGIISPTLKLLLAGVCLLLLRLELMDAVSGGTPWWERLGNRCLVFRLRLRARALNAISEIIERGGLFSDFLCYLIVRFRVHKLETHVMPNVQNSAMPDERCQPRMRN